jgi:hypothetical protein
MRELDRRERTDDSRHRSATKEKTDDGFLTVRKLKLKSGSYKDWCRACSSGSMAASSPVEPQVARDVRLLRAFRPYERDQEPDRSPARGPEAASLSQGIIDSDRPSIGKTAGSS